MNAIEKECVSSNANLIYIVKNCVGNIFRELQFSEMRNSVQFDACELHNSNISSHRIRADVRQK